MTGSISEIWILDRLCSADAYCVEKLDPARNSVKFAEPDLAKPLILLGHVSAETLLWGVGPG